MFLSPMRTKEEGKEDRRCPIPVTSDSVGDRNTSGAICCWTRLAHNSFSRTWKNSMLTTWRPRDEVRDNENSDTSSDDVTSLDEEQDGFITHML